VKGSRIFIAVLVVAVITAAVWKFVLPSATAKKPLPKLAATAKAGSSDQQAVTSAQRSAAEDPNASGSGRSFGGRSRRSRMADSNGQDANSTAGSGAPSGMEMPAGGMDPSMGMGMGMGGMDMSGMGGMGGMSFGGRSRRGSQGSSNDPTAVIDVNDINALEMINLQNVAMSSIVDKVSRWTGKVVIPTADTVMQQRITIIAPNKIRRIEALGLIFAALRSKGVAVEQSGNVIFLKPVPDTTKIAQVPVLAADMPLASLTDKNQMVQKSFVIRNYDIARMSTILTPLISPYGYISADENTGSITMIDTVENLMRLEKMIVKLDIPKARGSEERIYQLTTGDATAISDLVEKLMNTSSGLVVEQTEPNAGRSGNTVTSVVLEQKPQQVILVPESRNNWIIARATPEDMNSIGIWIGKLDKEMQVSPEYDILQVKYADVTDLTDKVTKTLQSMPGTGLKASVLVQPLPKSRQIMLFGSKEKREMVKNLVGEIDQPGAGMFIEKTFMLKNADPDAIKKNLDDLYGSGSSSSSRNNNTGGFGGGPGGFFARMNGTSGDSADTVKTISYPSLGQVTVIASPENMTKIAKQIDEWDVPVAVDKMKPLIIELTNSDPVKMADLLSKLFSQDSGSSSGSNSTRNWFAAYLGTSTGSDKQNIIGPLYGQLTFEAVPDTKKIIVISKIPAAYTVVEGLIHDLDKKELGETPTVIGLKYADPEDLCQRLNAMFNQSGTSASIPLSKSGLSDYSVNTETGQVTTGSTSNTNTNTSTYTPWWTRAQQSTTEAPISNIIGKIRFIPDTRSKSVMVLSPKEYIDDITAMIQKLDLPAKQVMVQAVILEVAKSDLEALGAEYSTNPASLGATGVNGASGLTNIMSASNTDATTAGAKPGTFNMTTNVNITTLVDLLVTKAHARILNQPTLWTRDNEEATFFKGKSVPFVTASQSDSTGTSVNNEITYRGVGVTLRVRPNITPEKAVDMTVNLSVSQLDAQEINGNPVTSLMDTTTKTIVSDGQTIMIGGIIYQTDTATVNKVPLLGDIPVLGAAFTHVNSEKSTAELIVFITPNVIDTAMNPDTAGMRKQEDALKRMDVIRGELREALGLDVNDVPARVRK
jgi:general secretion pathway protein D